MEKVELQVCRFRSKIELSYHSGKPFNLEDEIDDFIEVCKRSLKKSKVPSKEWLLLNLTYEVVEPGRGLAHDLEYHFELTVPRDYLKNRIRNAPKNVKFVPISKNLFNTEES